MFNIFGNKNYTNLSSQDFDSEMKGNYKLIDVRSRGEFKSGKIRGAINIPVHEIDENTKTKIGKADKILVYCLSGARSSSACRMLAKLGYENIYNLSGGISRWHKKIS